jgi:hypothetical protein
MTNIGMQNTPALENWLKRAISCLSAASAARVRTEIQEHCDSARESALVSGATVEEADRLAVASLGDAATANRQYRKVLVTTAEARLLREARWEGRAICSGKWLRWLPLIPASVLAGAWFFDAGRTYLPSLLLVGMGGLGLLFAARFLPIYTLARGRVFRVLRLALLVAILFLASWPHVLAQSWLLTSCLWPVVWVEWTFISLRRKLPVAEWPKQLYL